MGLSVSLYGWLAGCLPDVCLTVCLTVYLSVGMLVCLSVHRSLSVSQSVCVTKVCLSLCLPVSGCLSLSLSVCLSTCLSDELTRAADWNFLSNWSNFSLRKFKAIFKVSERRDQVLSLTLWVSALVQGLGYRVNIFLSWFRGLGFVETSSVLNLLTCSINLTCLFSV